MKIAVIIPCRNEQNNIEECINAIYSSEIPNDWQLNVFVVDGKSNDGTIKLLERLQQLHSTLQIIINVHQITPKAFNLGIHEGNGCDYVQIIGARQIISADYVRNAVEKLENDKSIWCIGGRVENVYQNYEGRVIANAMSTSLGMGLGNFRTISKSGFVDTVGTPMYPYWVFEKIGYFDEELIRNQDDDFNYRVTKAGGKIYFNADISLKYYVRGNFKNLWKQFYQYGYWKVYVNQKHKAVTTMRQLIPPVFVAYLFLFILSWLFGGFVGAVSSLPLLLYLALVSYVSYDITSKDQSLKFGDTFITFPILHISYGLGYLKGIFDFILLRKKPSDKQKELSR